MNNNVFAVIHIAPAMKLTEKLFPSNIICDVIHPILCFKLPTTCLLMACAIDLTTYKFVSVVIWDPGKSEPLFTD